MNKLIAYRIHPVAQRMVAGRSRRQWMDQTHQRYAYRCLPLTIANAMGWELLLPAKITAEWNGGSKISDIVVESEDPVWRPERLAISHFGHGVLTFPINYLFRTEPGIALWARGIPNAPKDGIAPLEGIIETDWLPFTFTMNWQFTRAGRITFEKDEPFCFLTPIAYRALEQVTPEIIPLANTPEIAAEFKAYSEARKTFNAKLLESDPVAAAEGWQKWYIRGENPFGEAANPQHISKLVLAQPIEQKQEFEPEGKTKVEG